MRYTARLVLVAEPERDASGAAVEWSPSDEPKPSCATCKWAEDSRIGDADPEFGWSSDVSHYPHVAAAFPLQCRKADDASEPSDWQRRKQRAEPGSAKAGAWSEGAFRGTLLVKPDFGCVQWEGK